MRRLRSVDAVGAALLAALGGIGACGGTTSPVDGGAEGGTTEGGGTEGGIESGAEAGPEGSVTTCSPHPCTGPVPLLIGGQDTGYDTCAGGALRRRTVVDCPSLLPRPGKGACGTSVPDAGGFCSSDADCQAKPYGHCELGGSFGGPGCFCTYGCVRDVDCGSSGEICVCADPVGQCEGAKCSQDTSCGPGCDCIDSTDNPGCPGKSFACQTPADQCTADSDCQTGAMCSRDPSGRHICATTGCAVGRPFLVRGEQRLASRAPRVDWTAASAGPDVSGLSPVQRARLAEHWTRIGLMEHASIAAFARFTLHLLSVGAPPDLVLAAQEAMGDETEHTRLAFALASGYAGAGVGPGPLSMDGALDGFNAARLVSTLLREGCVGETVAAIEAHEALEHAADPAVRAVLATIARDELRHAELAWKTLAWLVSEGRASRALVEAELARIRLEPEAKVGTDEVADSLQEHGFVGEALRSELRRNSLDVVVVPCARSLLRCRLVETRVA